MLARLLLIVCFSWLFRQLYAQPFSRQLDFDFGDAKVTASGDTLVGVFLSDNLSYGAGRLYPTAAIYDVDYGGIPSIFIDLADISYGSNRLVHTRTFLPLFGNVPDSTRGQAHTILHTDEGYANTLRFLHPDVAGSPTAEGSDAAPIFQNYRLHFFSSYELPDGLPAAAYGLQVTTLDAQDVPIRTQGYYVTGTDIDLGGLQALRGAATDDRLYLLFTSAGNPEREYPLVVSLGADLRPVKATVVDVNVDERGGKLYVYDDAVYILGNRYDAPVPGVITYTPQLTKLDADLNVLWSRRYEADRFPLFQAELAYSVSSDELSLTYNTSGFFPAIHATLDPSDGSIISQRGYNLYLPKSIFLASGNLAMVSPGAPATPLTPEQAPHFVLTDTDGTTGVCEAIPSCLFSEVVDVEALAEVTLDTFTTTILVEKIATNVTPRTVSATDNCFETEIPRPTFTLPTAACLGDTLRPGELNNLTANNVEWSWTGPGVDTVFRIREPEIVPSVPGEYRLEQHVWVLGCAESAARTITVTELYSIATPDQIYLCAPGDTLALDATAPTDALVWNHGPVGASIPIDAVGTYTVTAGSGTVCEAVPHSIHVRYLRDSIVPPFVDLPDDTLVCAITLPFSLAGRSAYAAPLLVNSSPGTELATPGGYTVGFVVDDCSFNQAFLLRTEDCTPEYYLPTAFSPNRDGINDFWQPSGAHVEWLAIHVYDRWGALRYDGSDGFGRWSGEEASAGVYVAVVRGRDRRTGEVVEASTPVTLLR